VRSVVFTPILQISVGANMQAAAAAGGAALAALLGPSPRGHPEEWSDTVRDLLHCFLQPFVLVWPLSESPSAATLVNKVWQRVMECPSALAATVEALQACPGGTDPIFWLKDCALVSTAVDMHVAFLGPSNAAGRRFAGWPAVLGSGSLQQFAVDALVWEAPSRRPPLPEEVEEQLTDSLSTFRKFLGGAAQEDQISAARLRTLFAHEGILAALQAVAEGREEPEGSNWPAARSSAILLNKAAIKLQAQRCSPEAYTAVQGTMLGVIRQGAVLLQLTAVAPAQRQRAVRRARRDGFLQVHRFFVVQTHPCIAQLSTARS
jgi:hypothetical protein